MGRRKVEMKQLADNSSRQVTFSKRRSGLFKKANELATLCGAKVAIIVFSPGGKPFSFGHPSVDAVVSRFLDPVQGGSCGGGTGEESRRRRREVVELNREVGEALRRLEAERRRGKMLERMARKGRKMEGAPIEKLGLGELEELKAEMEALRRSVRTQAREIEASSSLLLLADSLPHQE